MVCSELIPSALGLLNRLHGGKHACKSVRHRCGLFSTAFTAANSHVARLLRDITTSQPPSRRQTGHRHGRYTILTVLLNRLHGGKPYVVDGQYQRLLNRLHAANRVLRLSPARRLLNRLHGGKPVGLHPRTGASLLNRLHGGKLCLGVEINPMPAAASQPPSRRQTCICQRDVGANHPSQPPSRRQTVCIHRPDS